MSRGTHYSHVEFYLKKYSGSSDRVLEIGCGSAVYREVFAPRHYLGTDVFNPYYQDFGDVDVYNSAEALPFAEEQFDLVFSQAAIDYMPDLQSVLRETWRVLRPGGRMLVFTYNKKILARIHRDAQNTPIPSHRHYHVFTETELIAWLQQVGYKVTWLPLLPRRFLLRLLLRVPPLAWIHKRRSMWRILLAEKPE